MSCEHELPHCAGVQSGLMQEVIKAEERKRQYKEREIKKNKVECII